MKEYLCIKKCKNYFTMGKKYYPTDDQDTELSLIDNANGIHEVISNDGCKNWFNEYFEIINIDYERPNKTEEVKG